MDIVQHSPASQQSVRLCRTTLLADKGFSFFKQFSFKQENIDLYVRPREQSGPIDLNAGDRRDVIPRKAALLRSSRIRREYNGNIMNIGTDYKTFELFKNWLINGAFAVPQVPDLPNENETNLDRTNRCYYQVFEAYKFALDYEVVHYQNAVVDYIHNMILTNDSFPNFPTMKRIDKDARAIKLWTLLVDMAATLVDEQSLRGRAKDYARRIGVINSLELYPHSFVHSVEAAARTRLPQDRESWQKNDLCRYHTHGMLCTSVRKMIDLVRPRRAQQSDNGSLFEQS